MARSFKFILLLLFLTSTPATAGALSLYPSCQDRVDQIAGMVEHDNQCTTDQDCQLVQQPPCGCDDLAVNGAMAQEIADTIAHCEKEGILCEECPQRYYFAAPAANCVEGRCVVGIMR